INFNNAINFITKEFNSISMIRIAGWKDLNYIPADPKTTALKVNIITIILNIYQITQQGITVIFFAFMDHQDTARILFRITQTIDTRNRSNNYYVITLH